MVGANKLGTKGSPIEEKHVCFFWPPNMRLGIYGDSVINFINKPLELGQSTDPVQATASSLVTATVPDALQCTWFATWNRHRKVWRCWHIRRWRRFLRPGLRLSCWMVGISWLVHDRIEYIVSTLVDSYFVLVWWILIVVNGKLLGRMVWWLGWVCDYGDSTICGLGLQCALSLWLLNQ